MEVLESNIVLGNYQFDFVNEVKIESSWKEMTSTATVKLPAALKIDSNNLKKAIPVGSKVVIKLRYKAYDWHTLFSGYVTSVSNKTPVVFKCEDEMWKLKQMQINSNCKNEKMGDYLHRVLGVEVDAFDITIPSMVVHNTTGAKLLDRIKTEYGFHSFFRGDTLIVGKNYSDEDAKTHTIIIDQASNCNVKKQDLEYKSKEEVKLKVTAISNMPNGEKVKVELGDKDGEERTLNYFNLSKDKLEKIAQSEMDKLKYDGYRGNLTLFGAPVVFHGDILKMENTQDSDKTGEYFIDKVTYSLGTKGFEQAVEPGPKAN